MFGIHTVIHYNTHGSRLTAIVCKMVSSFATDS